MKAAANVVAVVAWCAFIGAVCYPLLAADWPPVGLWLGAVVMTFLVGVVVPSYLLNLEARMAATGQPAARPSRPEARGE